MLLEELDLDIPEELIAQEPAKERDSCRLMHLRSDGRPGHHRFRELPSLLQPGDLMVFNDSRVFAARVKARKVTGGEVEFLFVRRAELGGAHGSHTAPVEGSVREAWEVLARPSHRLRAGNLLLVGSDEVELRESLGEGRWLLQGRPGKSMLSLMDTHGTMPLPPYIKTYPQDPSSYQTVYAAESGSAAAPTAGLHFTPGLLEALAGSGVSATFVTLHVGLDTFQPIREAHVEDHQIHTEAYSVSRGALDAITDAHQTGRRIVAVGTTATRVLETLASDGWLGGGACVRGPATDSSGGVSGFTSIFITPGHRFKMVDVLLTNFHLPRSSVLALTMAFAGVDAIRSAYSEAVVRRYRFFSFGDAMLIDRPPARPGRSRTGP